MLCQISVKVMSGVYGQPGSLSLAKPLSHILLEGSVLGLIISLGVGPAGREVLDFMYITIMVQSVYRRASNRLGCI